MKKSLLFLALVILPGSAAEAQAVKDFIYLPAARLEEAVRTATAAAPSPVLATTLEQRDQHASIMVRRSESSGPEIHDMFDDVYIVHSGAATLLYGGTVAGAQVTDPGELRGGTISGGTPQRMSPGDVLVVPATVPHQVVIEPGNSIIYHVIKVRRGK